MGEVAEILSNECLDDSLGWTGELLRKSMLFACNIPNERVSMLLVRSVSML